MKIQGIIQEKTANSVKIENKWYKFFASELLTKVKINDLVNLEYKTNVKDGRTYLNGNKIEVIKESPKELTYDKIPDTTINTILMIAEKIYSNENTKLEYSEVVKDVLNGYKIIRDNL